jgi:hypothetical protein
VGSMPYHIITEHQSGFQPNDSTVNQLVNIYNTIISNLDIGKDIRFIFWDISKAFDRVIPSHPDENPSKTTFCFLSSK